MARIGVSGSGLKKNWQSELATKMAIGVSLVTSTDKPDTSITNREIVTYKTQHNTLTALSDKKPFETTSGHRFSRL